MQLHEKHDYYVHLSTFLAIYLQALDKPVLKKSSSKIPQKSNLKFEPLFSKYQIAEMIQKILCSLYEFFAVFLPLKVYGNSRKLILRVLRFWVRWRFSKLRCWVRHKREDQSGKFFDLVLSKCNYYFFEKLIGNFNFHSFIYSLPELSNSSWSFDWIRSAEYWVTSHWEYFTQFIESE